MSEEKQYWKVTDGCRWCVWETEQEAIKMIENEYDYFDEIDLWIEPTFMTEDEFNNLDEFDGF